MWGGGGGNAINRMIASGMDGVEFIAINTDAQVLELSQAHQRIQIGKDVTKGLGAGAKPEMGRQSIEEDKDRVAEALKDADLVFITTGMGGGTGTGACPVIAEIARDLDALTVGIVTKPFYFEGKPRMRNAETGIVELKEYVNTLIVIPNQRLLEVISPDTSITEAFRIADEILMHATRGISDLITVPGLINLDFNDVKTVMLEGGDALIGTGGERGEGRALKAAEQAINSPLLENISIVGAKGLLVNISSGSDLTLTEVNEAVTLVTQEAGDEANVIFGTVLDDSLEDEIRVTVIATGFNASGEEEEMVPMETQSSQAPIQPSDVPTVLRKKQESKVQTLVDQGETRRLTPDNMEYPTFLRKRRV